MAQVAASGAWTGVPDDTFSDLSEAERRGNVVFGFSGKRLQRDRMICGAVALAAAALMVSSLAIPAGVVLAISLACLAYFSRRLSLADRTAPLRFSADTIQAGATGRALEFSSVEDVQSQAPARSTRDALLLAAIVMTGHFVFLIRRSNMQTIRLGCSDDTHSLDLDLNVLDGDPRHIARVIDARIALAKRKA
jgi:hypothetical protein